jgi:hypothetical protein
MDHPPIGRFQERGLMAAPPRSGGIVSFPHAATINMVCLPVKKSFVIIYMNEIGARVSVLNSQ